MRKSNPTPKDIEDKIEYYLNVGRHSSPESKTHTEAIKEIDNYAGQYLKLTGKHYVARSLRGARGDWGV